MFIVKQSVIYFCSFLLAVVYLLNCVLFIWLVTPYGWLGSTMLMNTYDIPVHIFIVLYAITALISFAILRIDILIKLFNKESSAMENVPYEYQARGATNDKNEMYIVRNLSGQEVYRAPKFEHKISTEDGRVLYIERYPGVVIFSCSLENHTASEEYVDD